MGALTKQSSMDLTTGNLYKKIIFFSFPIMLAGLLQLLYTQANLVTIRIWGEGDSSVSAIGINGSLITLVIGLFTGLALGANVVMAHAKGRNDAAYAKKVLHSSIILSIIFGISVSIFGVALARYFLIWMNATDDIIDKATTYLSIYFLGMPFTMIYNYGAALQRALGDSKKPLYSLMISAVINIILNIIFVVVLKLDVAGAAIATISSEAIAATMTMYWLIKDKNGFVKFSFKDFKLDKEAALEVIRIGLPAGLESIIFSIANVTIQAESNLFGISSELGNSAASNIEAYLYAVMSAFSQAAAAFVAQNYGALKKDNIKKVLKISIILEVSVSLALGALMTTFLDPMLHIFISSDSQAMEIGRSRLYMILLTYFTCGIMDCYSAFYRSEKYTIVPMIVTLLGCNIVRMAFIFGLYKLPQFHTLMWLYATFPISWVLSSLIYFILYFFIQPKVDRKIDDQLAHQNQGGNPEFVTKYANKK